MWAQDKPFQPEPGKFPPIAKAKSYRGELVFVDHINRRGSLRLHIDGHFHEGRLHDFAMLPYGMIYYRGAPAQLRNIPIGTVLYGRVFLPPDPKTSAGPLAQGTRPSEPAETHAILLEDGPSFCLREGKSWKLKQIEQGQVWFLTARSRARTAVKGSAANTASPSIPPPASGAAANGSASMTLSRKAFGPVMHEGAQGAACSFRLRGIRAICTSNFTWPTFGSMTLP